MKNHLLPHILCLILALFVLTLPLVSCGNNETPPDSGNQGDGTGEPEEPETPVHTHTLVTVDEVSPTCQAEGVKAHFHCTECGKDFLDAAAGSEVSAYELVLSRVSHDYNDGFCRYCDVPDPKDRTLSDAKRLTSVSVTQSGLLSWSKLKIASKYKLTLTLADGTHDFEITKEKAAFSLSDLPEGVKLAYGRNAMTITVYEREEIEIDGEKGYQDIPLWGGQYSLVSLREGYEVIPLRYEDDIISLEGFYGEKRTEGNNTFLLSEVTLADGNKKVYPTLKKDLKAKKDGYTTVIYKSASGRENGTDQISVFTTPLSTSRQYYYVRVFDENSQPVADYDLVLRGVTYLKVEMAVETSETDSDGDRLYQFDYKIDSRDNIKFLQGDYMDLSPLFEKLPEGYILRDNHWNLYEPGKDYLLSADAYGVQEFYAAPAETLRAEAAELALYADTFELTRTSWKKNGTPSGSYLLGFSLRLKKNFTNEELRVPAKILGNRVILTASSFSFMTVRRVVLEPGFTELPDKLFYNTVGLTYVALPATVTDVGDWMFPKAQASVLTIYCEGRINSDSHWNQVDGSYDMFKTYYNKTGVCSSADVGDYTYRLDNDTLTVTGAKNPTPGAVPEKVKVGFKEYSVTSFADGSLSTVTAFEIPAFITEMNMKAFGDGLTTLTVSENHPTYTVFGGLLYNKELTELLFLPGGVTDLTFPETITEIADNAFKNKTGIVSVVLPDTCTKIGNYAFSGCTSLAKVTLPETLSEMGKYAFSGCTALTEIALPASLRNVSSYAFYNCSALERITFAEGTEDIEVCAFGGTAVSEITFPDSLKSIGYSALGNCHSLRRVVFGTGLTSDVGADVFNDSLHLREIINPTSYKIEADAVICTYSSKDEPTHFKQVGDWWFYENDGQYWLCAYDGSSSSLTLPTDYEGHAYKIASYAFVYNELQTVTISDNVTEIGEAAFRKLPLTEVNLGNGVTYIAASAFENCNYLGRFYGGNSVQNAHKTAFNGTDFIKSYDNLINGCTYIGYCLISGRGDTVVIRSDTKYIADSAFGGAYVVNAREIILPEGLLGIGSEAFYYCEYLSELTLPAGLVTVGKNLFKDSRHIIYVKSAKAGDGWDAEFAGTCPVIFNCDKNNLTEDGARYATVDELLYRIKDGKARVTLQFSDLFFRLVGSTELIIPDEIKVDGITYPVVEVEDRAFYEIDVRKETIILGKNVERIGDKAFSRESNSYDIDFNGTEKLTYIGANAFRYAGRKNKELVIPDSVQEIGDFAFGETSYTKVVFGTGIKKIGKGAFAGGRFSAKLESATFKVTDGWYYTTEWNNFKEEHPIESEIMSDTTNEFLIRLLTNYDSSCGLHREET